MRKVFLLIFVMLAAITASAQDNFRIIDRNVTFSGPVFALCKSKEVTNKTAIKYGDGFTFYIKNDRVGNDNFISFWIETLDGNISEYNSWKDNDVHIKMLKTEKGNNVYIISDDTFKYLTAIGMEDGKYGIQLYTTLNE